MFTSTQARIARIYTATIGYDPFEDDASTTGAEAIQTLREFHGEAEANARAAGFTQRIEWDSGDGFGGFALVQPGTDLEDNFTGFCLEGSEMLAFHGWAIFAEFI
ncbi:MAG: hypothetical protein JXQ91_07645 [Vannielia sp.]|uniref:hypothetical protein n=1 Tax=Vannielia sp. TaxID=2813045 RepID=UPI003B8B5255